MSPVNADPNHTISQKEYTKVSKKTDTEFSLLVNNAKCEQNFEFLTEL